MAVHGQKFALKIASPDMGNSEMINKVVKSCPTTELFISCGMHTQDEIESIREMFEKYNNIKWLYCVSMYPTPIEAIDIEEIKFYDGFSDHTIGLEAVRKVMAFNPNMGYYEKHFTLSKQLPIVDRDWSVTPDDLKYLKAILTYGEDSKKYKSRWTK
jgi:sialic acid synthase SpsE